MADTIIQGLLPSGKAPSVLKGEIIELISKRGLPIFSSQTEALIYEHDNPGSRALYIGSPISSQSTPPPSVASPQNPASSPTQNASFSKLALEDKAVSLLTFEDGTARDYGTAAAIWSAEGAVAFADGALVLNGGRITTQTEFMTGDKLTMLAIVEPSQTSKNTVFSAGNTTFQLGDYKSRYYFQSRNATAPMAVAGGSVSAALTKSAVVYDGTTLSIFSGGNKISTSSTSGGAFNSSAASTIGSKGGGTEPFNGKIIAFAIIPKALDEARIQMYFGS